MTGEQSLWSCFFFRCMRVCSLKEPKGQGLRAVVCRLLTFVPVWTPFSRHAVSNSERGGGTAFECEGRIWRHKTLLCPPIGSCRSRDLAVVSAAVTSEAWISWTHLCRGPVTTGWGRRALEEDRKKEGEEEVVAVILVCDVWIVGLNTTRANNTLPPRHTHIETFPLPHFIEEPQA